MQWIRVIIVGMGSESSSTFDRPFILVSGKGGTGKSTIAMALAYRFASLGKRVCLLERGYGKNYQVGRLHFPLQQEPLSHEPREVTLPGSTVKIWCSCLNPSLAMREYLELKFPIKSVAQLLFKNSLTSSFLHAIPGLPNLVTLGKIWHSLEKGTFDHVILDAPASGHLVPLLSSPRNFKKLTLAGPLFQDTSKIDSFFHDPKKMQILLCALPEELVFKETLELQTALLDLQFQPQLLLNRKLFTHEKASSKKPSAQLQLINDYFSEKADKETKCVKEFAKPFSITFPFLFPATKTPIYLQLAQEFL